MKLDRMALAFWEATNDLSALRLVMDDALEEIAAEVAKPGVTEPDRLKLRDLRRAMEHTRKELGSFRALCNVRIEECSPGILDRMASRAIEAAARRERATQGG